MYFETSVIATRYLPVWVSNPTSSQQMMSQNSKRFLASALEH